MPTRDCKMIKVPIRAYQGHRFKCRIPIKMRNKPKAKPAGGRKKKK